MTDFDPNEPACWSWPVPPIRTLADLVAEIEAANALLPRSERRDPRAAGYHMQDGGHRQRFVSFHAGRCAICTCSVGRIVEDHDHATGLIRGQLCQGCNVAEGRSGLPLFEAYRRRPPAVILDFRRYYVGFGWPDKWWENAALTHHLTGNRDWKPIEAQV